MWENLNQKERLISQRILNKIRTLKSIKFIIIDKILKSRISNRTPKYFQKRSKAILLRNEWVDFSSQFKYCENTQWIQLKNELIFKRFKYIFKRDWIRLILSYIEEIKHWFEVETVE